MSSGPEVTVAALKASGWQEAIGASASKDCYAYTKALSAAREVAEQAGDAESVAALTLLVDVCTPWLWSDKDEVFGPRDIIDAILDAQLDALAALLPDIVDAELNARISDILWLRRHDRRAAQLAVKAYVASAATLEDPTDWVNSFARTERALRIAASLGKKNAQFSDVVAHIVQTLCLGSA